MRRMYGVATPLFLTMTCIACVVGDRQAIVGSGVSKRETRTVAPFTGVDISASFQAEVRVGPEASVVVEADDNLLPMVRTEVRDGRLSVGLADGVSVRTKADQKVTVVTPSLEFLGARGAARVEATAAPAARFTIEAEGAGSADVRGLASDLVEVRADGASKVKLSGSGKRLKLVVEGASNVESSDSAFEAVEARIEGASRANVLASSSIEGDISGASSLKVRGEPKDRRVKTSGASSVSY